MSHDLHFTVTNGDGQQIVDTVDRAQSGELDHLPDSSAGAAETQRTSFQYISEQLQQSAHPWVIIFHVLFKGLALAAYLFGGWVLPSSGGNFVNLTVTCILLLAADFWVVKNVTGRLLVGLRWWNKVENDTTTWIFESAEDKAVNKFDRSVFWTTLYGTPLVWAGLFVFAIMRFHVTWLMIVVIALALNGANVYGYYKCSTDQKAKFQQMMQQGAQQGAMAMMQNNMIGILTGQR